MAFYQFYNCQKCNYPLIVNRSKDEVIYGSPVQQCPRCGEVYLDKNYCEIAIIGLQEIDKGKFSLNYILFLFLSCFAIVGGIIGISMGYDDNSMYYLFIILGSIMSIFNIWMIVSEVKDHKNRIELLEKEAVESEKRLKNYEYAAFLESIGYDVPEKYLLKENQDKGNLTNK